MLRPSLESLQIGASGDLLRDSLDMRLLRKWRARVILFTAVLLVACRPANDEGHPDYWLYAEIFAELRNAPYPPKPTVLDFGPLNGGDWTTACFFGGYWYPADEMAAKGGTVKTGDQGLGEVPEFSIVISYIDTKEIAHFIRFSSGIGSQGQHLRRCVTKPATTVILDDRML